jgi:hypothetical protein
MKKIVIGIGIYTVICFVISAAAVISERRTKKKLKDIAEELDNFAYIYGDNDYLSKLFEENE